MASHSHLSKLSPAIQDILKSLKNGLTDAKLKPHEDCKVWLREDGKLVIERPEDLWKKHFDRRKDNCADGFFTAPCEPYRCLGGSLTLETSDLLYQTLSDYLKRNEKCKTEDSIGETSVPKTEVAAVHKEVKCCNSRRRPATGFELIQESLKIGTERIVALRGGLPYMEHIKRTEKRLEDKEEKPINGMILMSTNDLAFMFHAKESTTSRSASSLKQSRDGGDSDSIRSNKQDLENKATPEKDTKGQTKETPVKSEKSVDSLLGVSSALTERLNRLRGDNLEFLKAVHRIMIILRNIKSKDLKSRHPLTQTQIRDMEKERKVGKLAGLSLLQKRPSTDTNMSPDMSPPCIPSRHTSLLAPTRRKTRLLTIFGHGGPLVSLTSRMNTTSDRRSRMAGEREVRVETWDDLLRIGEKTPEPHPIPEVTVNVIPDIITPKPTKCSRYTSANEQTVAEEKYKPTIWQVIANEKVKSKGFQDMNKHVKAKDPANICQRLQKEMETLNANLKESCNTELKKLNRERLSAFRYKFGTLRETSTLECHFANMRQPREYIVNRLHEMPDVIPSKWLDELTEKIHNLVGPEESEINVALAHLGQHSQASVKNIPQTKARLCLIVMSLPAYEICKISTQLAIKFVLEKVFQGPVEEFYHWLSLRKLPLAITK
ncbi:hypothetical protein SNE40_005638 [Patella caerulea]|uniref:Uncharacterized protein n=1 Tax=Patella caerulea TaxID=87958 RepID=A0AAN8Q4W9_PATCE